MRKSIMKKKYSLKRNEEIAKIVQNKQAIRNGSFIVFYKKNNLEFSRVCISVSKKLGIAVVRNKIKRQVREMVTDIFEFEKSFDYVIVVKGNYLSYDFQTNHNRLKELYGKLNPNKERIINEQKI